MRAGVATAGILIAGATTLLLASRSDASLTPRGRCTVLATVTPGNVKIDPAQSEGPFTVPREGRVRWLAALTAPEPAEPRAFRGALAVVGPGGLDDLLEGPFEFREWSNPGSRRIADGGGERYELPSWTPRGVDIPVRGFQRDDLGGCRGEILVRVEGGRFDSPLAWIAVGGTLFWLGGTLLAGKLRDEPHRLFCVGAIGPAFLVGWLLALSRGSTGGTPLVWGLVLAGIALVGTLAVGRQEWARDFWGGHPALGWVAGLALGIFVSLDLFVFGIVRLDSGVLLVPPILGMLVGLAMAWWTPFRGRSYA
jgi:hypothetical protein